MTRRIHLILRRLLHSLFRPATADEIERFQAWPM